MPPTLKQVMWVMGLLGFTLVIDVIAVRYGFPYGYFAYGDGLGPMILEVPILLIIGFPIVFVGASALANRAQVQPGVPFMLTVALIMLAVSLVVDPGAVAQGYWVFRNGGEYLGVPVANFVGWLFTGSLAAFLFPSSMRSEKAVASLLLIIAVATVVDVSQGLIVPSIIGLLLMSAVAWFDLKKHGWRS